VDEQLVIIGGNTAGLAAALAARRRRADLRILVLEASGEISWGACGLPYNLADPTRAPEDLRVRPAAFFHEQDIQLALGQRVLAVDPTARRLQLERRGAGGVERLELAWDRLVVASGARSRELTIPGLPATRLAPLKTLDDLRAWKERLGGLRRVAVAGAGPLGLELCEALRQLGLEVLLVDPEPLPLKGWPRELRAAVAAELERQGVRLRLGWSIRRAEDQPLACRLELESPAGGTALEEVELVAACAGITPNTEFLPRSLERTAAGALAVSAALRVGGLPVWAAGDCACREPAVPARAGESARVWNPQAREALTGGRVAGWNAAAGADERQATPGTLTQVLRCFGLELARCGRLSEPDEVAAAPAVVDIPPVSGLLGLGMARAARPSAAAPAAVRRSRAAGQTLGHALPGAGRLEVWLEAEPDGRLRGGAILSEGCGGALRINPLAALLQRAGTAAELAALDLAYSPPFGPLADPLLRAAEHLSQPSAAPLP